MDSFEFAALLVAIAVIVVAVVAALSVGRKRPRRSADEGAAMTAGTFSLAVSSHDGASGDGGGGCD